MSSVILCKCSLLYLYASNLFSALDYVCLEMEKNRHTTKEKILHLNRKTFILFAFGRVQCCNALDCYFQHALICTIQTTHLSVDCSRNSLPMEGQGRRRKRDWLRDRERVEAILTFNYAQVPPSTWNTRFFSLYFVIASHFFFYLNWLFLL